MKVDAIKLFVIGVIAFSAMRAVLAAIKKMTEQPVRPPLSVPSTQPHRARRLRSTTNKQAMAAPVLPVAETVTPVSPEVPVPKVSCAPRARSSGRFMGRAALRQAIVAREVLGPPLSLRPPRF